MGNCTATKKHVKDEKENPELKQKSENQTPQDVSKPVNIPRYSEAEKNDQVNDLKNANAQRPFAETLLKIGSNLHRLLTKLNLNIPNFVKGFSVDMKGNKSDSDLVTEFEHKKEELKSSMQNDAVRLKEHLFNDHGEFTKYKSNFESSKEKLKPTIKIFSHCKENIVFQLVSGHWAVLEQLAKKCQEGDNYDFFSEIKRLILSLHHLFFSVLEHDEPADLERIYLSYVDDEFKLFSLFHREEKNL